MFNTEDGVMSNRLNRITSVVVLTKWIPAVDELLPDVELAGNDGALWLMVGLALLLGMLLSNS